MPNARTQAPTGQTFAHGCALVLMTGLVMSTSGLIVRHIDAGDWQIVFYRSLAMVIALLSFLLVRDGSRALHTIRKTGITGLVAGIAMSMSTIGFVLAVNATSVANAVFLLASAPFLAALLGWLFLRERVAVVTWAAMAAALVGVAIMVWHGLTGGSLFGTAMGLVTALGFAGFSVALRGGRHADMVPSVSIGGGLSLVLGAAVIFFSGTGLALPASDIVLSMFFGVMTAGGLAVFTLGARSVPAAILALLSLVEVVLQPIWVWIFLDEVPHTITVVGGSILLAAIAGQAIVGMFGRGDRTVEQRA